MAADTAADMSADMAAETARHTETLPVLPLTTGVVLPQMVVTLALETREAKAAADAALAGDRRVLLVPRTEQGFAPVGTVAHIEDAGDLPSGIRALVVRGVQRAVIGAGVAASNAAPTLWVEAELVDEGAPASPRAAALAREYRAVVENILEQRGARQVAESLRGITHPGAMADTAGYSPDLSFEQKVEVLETVEVEQRLERVLAWARETLADLTLKERIRSDVADGMEKTQREFLLRQQLAAIRKELGEDGGEGVVEELRRRLGELQPVDAVRTAVEREIDRLERMPEQNPEHGWIRTWLETMLELPWGKRSDDRLDIGEARRILDADHTGLDDVKDRIVEELAVRERRAARDPLRDAESDTAKVAADEAAGGRGTGLILALVGPPGVGKTSLGESIARALGRKFVRLALGGIRDEAEIRGHRRTYVGAMPGRIARALKEAGTMNPVIVLDEVDKVGSDWRGDPSSALLEVLDPAQNHTFRDHYLEVDLDLSEVLFLATANVAETIPGPLLDRMEVVRLDGYTEEEKVAIAREHLLARQLERNGLHHDEVAVTDAALRAIVVDHTREAGVRTLERELGRLLRKAVTRLSAGDAVAPLTIDADGVREYLGRPKFFSEAADRTGVPGVATGLAVTGAGGDVLFVEAIAMDGEPGLGITGQLGDVMKESAEIALSYVRAHADELEIPPGRLARRFHLHVPAGAVPKDGPSAGVTMTTALVSLLTGRPVRSDVGMTGEVTLQGRVLPIGGVKQKVLAAHRAGLRDVVLPERNAADLEDVPATVREALRFHLAGDVRDVLAVALEPARGEEPVAA
jgi:ATP-dependent Lon protease